MSTIPIEISTEQLLQAIERLFADEVAICSASQPAPNAS
jgi:hypothetical protein